MPVREADEADLDEVTAMVLEHAAHENASDRCRFNAEEAGGALFGKDRVLRALIAVPESDRTVAAGCALWYTTFSSWASTRGIWVEDLYVRPAYRGTGLGRELLMALRQMTGGRIEWDVHVTNAEARRLYERLGAEPVTEWTKFRWTI